MDVYLGQLVLAARNSDGEDSGWMQLLVFLVLGVIWAVGGIMKARGEKDRNKKEDEKDSAAGTKIAKRQQKWPVQRRVRSQGVGPSITRTPQVRPITVEGQSERIGPVRVSITKGTAEPAGIIAKDVQQVSQVARDAIKTAEKGQVEPSVPITKEAEFLAPVSIASEDELRAAILHYEILGKCVAERDATYRQ